MEPITQNKHYSFSLSTILHHSNFSYSPEGRKIFKYLFLLSLQYPGA